MKCIKKGDKIRIIEREFKIEGIILDRNEYTRTYKIKLLVKPKFTIWVAEEHLEKINDPKDSKNDEM